MAKSDSAHSSRSTRSGSRNEPVSPHIAEHAGSFLTAVKGLQYNTNVNPIVKACRNVDVVWGEMVHLFNPNKKKRKAICPQALKKIIANEHISEFEFSKALHNELRKELDAESLIEACETADPTKQHQKPIVFKSGHYGDFAIGIMREVNGEQTNHESLSAPKASKEDGSRESESNLVNRAKLDHGVCLLRKGKNGKWKVANCVSAVELKLVGTQNQCRAIPEGVTGTSPDWLHLAFFHGALAQVMLYIMEWVLPSLAKLGQLDNTIPWAVVVGKRKPKQSDGSLQSVPNAVVVDNSQVIKISPGAQPEIRNVDSFSQELYSDEGHITVREKKRKKRKRKKKIEPPSEEMAQSQSDPKNMKSPRQTAVPNENPDQFRESRTSGTDGTDEISAGKKKKKRKRRRKSNKQPPDELQTSRAKTPSENIAPNMTDPKHLKSPPQSVPPPMGNSDQLMAPPFVHIAPRLEDSLPPKPGNVAQRRKDSLLPDTDPNNFKKFNHWVSGNIYVPSACGDCYKYAVTGYEWLQVDSYDNESAGNALSVYLETILFGLYAAKNWLDTATEKGEFVAPVATSGKHVTIGEKELKNLKLWGRAGRFAVANLAGADPENREKNDECIINQGEIFKGKLNIQQVTQEVSLDLEWYRPFGKTNKEVPVVVKVFSKAVHKYLTDPEHAWRALGKLHSEMLAKETAKEIYRSKKAVFQLTSKSAESTAKTLEKAEKALTESKRKLALLPQKLPSISDVLLGVHRRVNGLVTIMTDLSVKDFKVLRPKDCSELLPALWKAYLILLKEVLIPMANCGVIHPDMRPGYEETANILYKTTGKGEKAKMKLIDFESLSLAKEWTAPQGEKRSLYIKYDPDANAFLWKQSVAIAFAWKNKKYQSEMAGFRLKEVVQEYRNGYSNLWLGDFFNSNDGPQRMTEDLVPHLQNLFQSSLAAEAPVGNG